MRKILSGFLATAMVASMCGTMSFAIETSAPTPTTIKVDMSGVTLETKYTDSGTEKEFDDTKAIDAGDAELQVDIAGGGHLLFKSTQDIKGKYTAQQIAAAFQGAKGDIDSTSPTYADGKTAIATNSVVISVSGTTLKLVTATTGKASDINVVGITLSPEANGTDTDLQFDKRSISYDVITGENGEAITVDAEGDLLKKFSLDQVILTKANGDPRALTEKVSGVDKDQNDGDGIQSGKTLYFMVQPGDYRFDDDTYWKLKITKGDNGKYIKAISDVSKTFSNNLYDVVTGKEIEGTGGARHRYIKVELNEIYTDDEYKITLDLRLSPKSKATNVYKDIKDGDEVKVSDFYFYMKNIVRGADNDWKVGINGLMLEPLENDWNNITWYDEDGDLAHLKFFADSDVGKFYSKLSTKWEHADYASYFNDQDAFTFQFTGSPKLSATSRADLEIYNPFVDEDGNETIDPATAVIYQVIDGDLFDITDSFSYEEGDNGDMAFKTRTRFLGTYIICEKAVEEAADDADVPADLVPEDTTPSEVTPDNNNGGKAPANTGKYL